MREKVDRRKGSNPSVESVRKHRKRQSPWRLGWTSAWRVQLTMVSGAKSVTNWAENVSAWGVNFRWYKYIVCITPPAPTPRPLHYSSLPQPTITINPYVLLLSFVIANPWLTLHPWPTASFPTTNNTFLLYSFYLLIVGCRYRQEPSLSAIPFPPQTPPTNTYPDIPPATTLRTTFLQVRK